MGLTSGRGSRAGARRRGRNGYAGRENDGQRGYTSLVSRDGYGQPGAHTARGGYAGHAGHGGYVSTGGYRGDAGAGGYAHRDGYGSRDGYGYPEPDRYARQDGYRQVGADGGHEVPEERAGHGLSTASGRLSAFIRRGGRRGGYHLRARYGRRRRISVPVIAMVAVLASVAVVAAAAGVNRMLTARPAAADAPAIDMNCTLIVPADPLTAGGLATPYQLTATDPANGPCNEVNTSQTAFVQGAVLDPATGRISVYNPLVIDAGAQPAVAPVVPALPAGAVVAVWFGFNGNTLTLAGADQAQALTAPGSATAGPSSPAQGTPSGTAAASGAATAAGTPAATASPAAPGTDPAASPAASATQPGQGTASPSAPASASPSAPSTPATATAAAAAVNSAPATAAPKAAAEAEGAAPLSPADAGSAAGYDATLTRVAGYGSSQAGGRSGTSPSSPAVAPSAPASQPAAGSPAASVSPSAAGSAAGSAGAAGAAPASGSASAPAPASASTAATPPAAAGDGPAASGTPDMILQQANCVAGQNFGGQFSSFTQVGACNAVAFFRAANTAIRARKLTVPAPGTASDGKPCLTTRSFALIDQDQSDNVTTQYLAEGNGQTAQDTAANRQAMSGAAELFNGSDNGLLDLFVDPALGCTPWQAPNLADGGAPASALPLDELQAARYTGGRGNPSALVPLNDPMTLDNNGQFSTAKTNTYRSLVDMPPLPAGQSPAAYCLDMERIQGKRLQQDVNLLIGRAGPAPDAANSLFTFLAMRLQQSFGNLNCGSFGIRNVVSTTADASGVVVAACFLNYAAPVTPGSGNPMGATATCPATTAAASPSGPAGQPGAGSGSPGPGSSASASAPAASPTPSSSARQRHYRRHHWWW